MKDRKAMETSERLRRGSAAFEAFLAQFLAVAAASFLKPKRPELVRVAHETRDSLSLRQFTRK